MSLEDLYGQTPIPPADDPSQLGVPPPAQIPMPQMAAPVPQAAGPQGNQRALLLGALAAMLTGGKAMTGLGAGIRQGQAQADQQRQQLELLAQRQADVQQRQAAEVAALNARNQQQYQQSLVQRLQQLMSAVGSIREQVKTLKNKKAYDEQIEGFANLLRSSGYRVDGNWLRTRVPFVAPDKATMASQKLDQFLADPINKAVLADPQRLMAQSFEIDLNGDGVPEKYPAQEFYAIAGRQLAVDPQTGQPYALPASVGKPGSPFQEILMASRNQFSTENRRPPTPVEDAALIEQATKKAKAAQGESGLDALARETSELRNALLGEQVKKARLENQPQPDPGAAYATERAVRTSQSIEELLPQVSWKTVGPMAAAALPGTPAADFAAALDTLKANIGFNELTEMRQASKTGGALGQVSNIELTLLTSTLGALNTRQSPAAFKKQLEKIKASLQRWSIEKQKAGVLPGPVSSHTKPSRGRSYGGYAIEVEP